MDAIIGSTGLVGGYLSRMFNAEGFHSKNIHQLGNCYNRIFCSGIPAAKWIANKDPTSDWSNIEILLNKVKNVTCKQFVLISTIDVNNDHEPYGKHRKTAELKLKEIFGEKLVIIRLPALFGFGIKKNIIYDFIHRKKCIIQPKSQFQWYSLDWLNHDIHWILEQKLQEYDLYTEPIPNSELIDFLRTFSSREIIIDGPIITYNFGSDFWKTKTQTMHALKRFVTQACENRVLATTLNHPSVKDSEMYETTPFSAFGNVIEREPCEFEFLKDKIYSLQALFYPHNWFIDKDYNLIQHYLQKLIDIACFINVKVLVFGSPKLRSVQNASEWMTKLLSNVNHYIGDRDLQICMEPNAKHYNCSFLTTAKETYYFVHSLQLKHINMMLDFGNMHLENESIYDILSFMDKIKHIHFSCPDLKPLSEWDQRHQVCFWRHLLLKNGYLGKFTLECLNLSEKQFLDSMYYCVKDVEWGIVGGGWYGSHFALQCQNKGYSTTIYEQNHIFANVSSQNQNRLHLGYHYPRSHNTRKLCKSFFDQFQLEYPFLTRSILHNLYFVSLESNLDFMTFKQIMNAEGLSCDEVSVDFIQNTYPSALKVNEQWINWVEAQEFFTQRLAKHLSIQSILNPHDLTHSHIVDSSYNDFGFIENATKETSVSLIYRSKTEWNYSITMMDGEFFSLYPFDMDKRLFTLTHVKFGRLEDDIEFIREKMELDLLLYFPSFLDLFDFVDFFRVQKHGMKSKCASREVQVHQNTNVSSIACGKISGIFHLQNLIL